MRNIPRGSECGLSLLELTLALALFSIVLGMAAQGLISYNVALMTQTQRTVALSECRSVLDGMRAVRDANPGNFPEAVTERWPNGRTEAGGPLRGQTRVVRYTDPEANPLEVEVRIQWRDLRGRPVFQSLSTVLTDR